MAGLVVATGVGVTMGLAGWAGPPTGIAGFGVVAAGTTPARGGRVIRIVSFRKSAGGFISPEAVAGAAPGTGGAGGLGVAPGTAGAGGANRIVSFFRPGAIGAAGGFGGTGATAGMGGLGKEGMGGVGGLTPPTGGAMGGMGRAGALGTGGLGRLPAVGTPGGSGGRGGFGRGSAIVRSNDRMLLSSTYLQQKLFTKVHYSKISEMHRSSFFRESFDPVFFDARPIPRDEPIPFQWPAPTPMYPP